MRGFFFYLFQYPFQEYWKSKTMGVGKGLEGKILDYRSQDLIRLEDMVLPD